jgi:hypothetical protein
VDELWRIYAERARSDEETPKRANKKDEIKMTDVLYTFIQ